MAISEEYPISLKPPYRVEDAFQQEVSVQLSRPTVVATHMPLFATSVGSMTKNAERGNSRLRGSIEKLRNLAHIAMHPIDGLVNPAIDTFWATGTGLDGIENSSDIFAAFGDQ